MDSGYAGWDGAEFAADFSRCIRLRIPSLVDGGPAEQVEKDDGLRPSVSRMGREDRAGRFRPEDLRQGKAEQGQATEPQELATRKAAADLLG